MSLRYIYADEPSESRRHRKTPVLTAETLSALPRELVRAMQAAVAEGDITRLSELIDRVELLDSVTAQGLKVLADRYAYKTLDEFFKGGDSVD